MWAETTGSDVGIIEMNDLGEICKIFSFSKMIAAIFDCHTYQ